MKKNHIIWIIILILLVYVLIAGSQFLSSNKGDLNKNEIKFDARNSSFLVDGELVSLKNGAYKSDKQKIVTQYFGNEAIGDLNGDNLPDTAFLITQDTGGTGTFFYVVVALKKDDGYKTTNAIYVGDRISPQTTEIHSDSKKLYVNFAERRPDEPMTAEPTIGTTLFLKINSLGLLEGSTTDIYR